MADAWGGSWGQSWGVSWGSSPAAVVGSGGGSYRHWTPRPERKKSPEKLTRVEKVAVIEAITTRPIRTLDLSFLTDAIKQTLSIEVPDYLRIVAAEQRRAERAREKELEGIYAEEAAMARAYAEVVAEEARIAAAYYETQEIKRQEELRQKRKAAARERNLYIINSFLNED